MNTRNVGKVNAEIRFFNKKKKHNLLFLSAFISIFYKIKDIPNYRISRKIIQEGCQELQVVDYGRMVSTCKWGGAFVEIARWFGATESKVRNTVYRL